MPGILPMKVIKVGNSAQSRVAQACDRCRSKKIRCDGVRPTCSQCALVGFECRTSDKLSRRAFPRGYTESLEERVRSLEAEVRELKDLLDEKDEKIDILSAMHHGNHRHGRNNALSGASTSSSSSLSSSSPSFSSSSNTTANGSSPPPPKLSPATKKTCFRVQATQLLLGIENSDSYFMGPSSGRAFIASLKHKMGESGKPGGDFNPDAFLHIQGCAPLDAAAPDKLFRIPPRLFSDRCVNVFFQEWAPLFPILHRPTFLRIYDEFVNDAERVKFDFKLAQLYLVFSIAGLSLETPDIHLVANCERRWTKALESLAIENTMDTLQCLILAMLYCAMRADYRRLQHYKSIAVGLSHRLGLHQSQKRFSFGALTLETRKKVFWSLYALDCFTAATLGLPKLLKDEDVQAEYPSDVDDEYITEKGFRPTLPGEYTRISSALALFRASRVLARVLEKNYPAPTSYELSLEQMGALESELDAWYNGLPQHLRLGFVHGKLSTDVTGSRSPLLALAYYHIKTLIYRPVVGSSLGADAAPALMNISTCSKHMIQISQLLEERSMAFSFCINKGDMLAMCGLTLLYQAIDMGQESKLVQESTRLIKEVLKTMQKMKSPGLVDLERAAQGVVHVGTAVHATNIIAPAAANMTNSSARNHAAALSTTTTPSTSTTASSTMNTKPKTRRKPHSPASLRRSLTLTDAAQIDSSGCLKSHHSCQSTMSEAAVERRPDRGRRPAKAGEMDAEEEARLYALRMVCKGRPAVGSGTGLAGHGRPNLDYLELQHCQARSKGGDGAAASQRQPVTGRCSSGGQASAMGPLGGQGMAKSAGISHSEWESLLGVMEGGPDNVHNAIYGGASMLFGKTGLVAGASGSSGSAGQEWSSPESWEMSGISIGELGGKSGAAQSVLSMSDESLSSGEEMASELGMRSSVGYQKPLQGFQLDDLDSFLL